MPKPTTSKRLKILVLSSKGGGTGCALRARYIAEAFRKRGHEVTFLRPIPSLPLWLDMLLSEPYYYFQSFFRRHDAALAVKPYPNIFSTLWGQRFLGAKVVIDVDDLDYAYSHGWFRKFHQAIQKPLPKWADLVTYHNPKLKEPIRDFFKVPESKMVQLAQGVDRSLFKPGKAEASQLPAVAASLVKRKEPILAFTAHLNVACDLEPVLEAFRTVLKSLPSAHLLIAGGGPDEGRFKRKVQELGIASSTHFTGYLTPRQVAACLKASDAALVYYRDTPVNTHRASMKLREALACGCRVVSTDVGEAVQWKNALFLSKPEPGFYAKAVLKALKSKKRTQAAALLVKKWDWTDCVKDLESKLLHRQDAKTPRKAS